MRIEVKGRNITVSEDLREHVERRFRVIDKQVSELADLEVEVFEEPNPSIADCGRRGDPASEGRDAASVPCEPRSEALRERRQRGARRTGQAPPREAPQAA